MSAELELLLFHAVDEIDDLAEDVVLDERPLEAVLLVQLLHVREELGLLHTRVRDGIARQSVQLQTTL